MLSSLRIITLRRILPALQACMVVLLSTGCISRPDTSIDEEGRVVLTWMAPTDLNRNLYIELVEEFEARNPDIRIHINWIPSSQYQMKLKTLIAAGSPPDLFYCGDVWIAYYLPFLYDLTEFVERDRDEIALDDFYPALLEGCQQDDRYYFLPRWFNVSLLYYNLTLFDEAGVDYPTPDWTWDDYLEAAKRLTRRNERGAVEVWGTNTVPYWWGEWLILVRQSGGRLFNEDITRCTLDTPEAIRGMQFYSDKIHKHQVSPRPGHGPDLGFASGRMAMEFGGHTGQWPIFNSIEGLEWDIEILPEGPVTRSGGELSLEALGVSRDIRHPEEAWEFVKFMSTPESIRRYVEAGYLSARMSVAEETLLAPERMTNPRNIEAVYHALEYAQPVPKSPDFIELALEVIQPDIDIMLANGTDVGRTCRKVAEFANDFLKVVAGHGGSE